MINWILKNKSFITDHFRGKHSEGKGHVARLQGAMTGLHGMATAAQVVLEGCTPPTPTPTLGRCSPNRGEG